MSSSEVRYQSGFGNEFATEAVPALCLPGQNSPQQAPLGLYAEQLSGTPFTAPRAVNRRTWTYRIRPSVTHKPFAEHPAGLIRSGPFDEVPTPPNQLRWDPLPIPETPTDFVDGLVTMAGNGDPAAQTGVAIHIYAANASMQRRFFYNADGELLIVPQQGRAADSHRARHARRRARRNLRDAARHQVPCRAAGRRRPRLRLRKLRRAIPPAGTRPDRRQRPRQRARFPDARGCLRRSRWRLPHRRQVPRAGSGSPRSITRRWTSSPGTATTRRINTIWRASTASTR